MEFIKEISGYPIVVLKKLYRHRGQKLSFDIMFSEQEDINADDYDKNSLSKRAKYLEYLANLGLISGARYNRYKATVQITYLGEQFVQTFLHPKLKSFLFIKHINFNNVNEIKCNQIKRFVKNNSVKSITSNGLQVVHSMSMTCNQILKKCLNHKFYKIDDCYDDLSTSDNDRNDEIQELNNLGLINVTEHGDEIGKKRYYVCSIAPLGKLFLKKYPQILHSKEITANNLINFYQNVTQLNLPDDLNNDLPVNMSSIRYDIDDLCSYGHPYHHGV